MNNTILLIKTSLINSFGLNRFLKESSKSEKTKMIFIGVAILWAVVAVFASSIAYFYMISDALIQLDALSILLVISFINVSLVSLFMSIYKASGFLFSFNDYDLLMSLPVKTSEVLMSKLLLLYGTNLTASIIMGFPSLLVYGRRSSSGPMYYVFALMAMVFISFIPMIIGATFSFALGKISTRFRSTNIVMILGSFILIILLMIGSNLINNISAEFIQNITELMDSISKVYFPIKFYTNALVNIDIVSLLVFMFSAIIPLVLFVLIFAKSFKTINSKMNESYKVANYKMTSLKVSSVLQALYKKEINFYFSSYIYVLNTAMGVVMMTIFTIGIAVFGGEKVSQILDLPMISQFLVPATTAILSLSICLTCTTASSISLEGNNLWILKSLPIKPIEVFKGKILMNLTIILPALFINTLILAISFKMTLLSYILFLVTTTLYAFLISMAGIMINLYLPKLEWKSHMVVVKQSASVIISMLAGAISVFIPILLFVYIKPTDFNLFSTIIILCLTTINILLWTTIRTKGIQIFEKL
ncbi:ABC transporter permease [Proteiniborus sp.]|uniref:ABC transporter permease n=1 Tax=Proteiniborus sp. TaxID=2079015 RepID=UPI0033317142